MYIQKLAWAGLLVGHEETTILIDPLGYMPEMFEGFMGEPHERLTDFDTLPNVNAVFCTHDHGDHFDPVSIGRRYGSHLPVYLPEPTVLRTMQKGDLFNIIGAKVGDSFQIGSLKITAVQSVDGFATPQVAWVIEGGGQRIFHGGDTLWHGYWWEINRHFHEFDAVLLPVNGAVVDVPMLPRQSEMEACLNPEQAVEAAYLLGAKQLIPMHHGAFHYPGHYEETPNVLSRLHDRAAQRGVELTVLAAGGELEL
jgi:L-ascorbate metabolism protein UlaG (beta-lactamase superfamily)